MATTKEKLDTILIEQLCIMDSVVKPEATIESFGADSLDKVEIIMAIEDEFNIDVFDDELLKKETTVADLISLINVKIKTR